MKSPRPLSILVTGDYGIDHDVYLHSELDNPPPDNPPTIIRATFGGAGIIARVLNEAVRQHGKALAGVRFASSAKPTAPPVAALWLPGSPARTSADKGRLWRMKRSVSLGKLSDAQAQIMPDEKVEPLDGRSKTDADIVVIEDDAGEFRLGPPGAFQTHLQSWMKSPPHWIVLKTCAPVCHGKLWWMLSGAEKLMDRLAVIVSIKDLRLADIRVSQGISWERTAQDLLHGFTASPALAELRLARHVIVTFHNEGALWMERTGRTGEHFRLFFDPAHMEGEWSAKTSADGGTYGFHSTFAAAIAARIALSQNPGAKDSIKEGIRRGLLAMRLMQTLGHGGIKEDEPTLPAVELGRLLACKTLEKDGQEPRPVDPWDDHGSFACLDVPLSKDWRILEMADRDRPEGKNALPLYGKARRVALLGLGQLDNVPYARFGNYFTADRDEIESLRNLNRLIQAYSDDQEAKPLSLAVFGPPGAGKSFGIKQVAGAVIGERKRAFLEFNLSQFDDSRELIGAFHQVRDKVLEGKLPVVFWDEFDSQQYKWLQYLLAPMQDGKFQEGQLTHPIGRCIFVFAGATSYTYENFGPPEEPLSRSAADRREHRLALADYKLKKGPDFISRLHGYLNVLGPNPRQKFTGTKWEDDPSDVCFPVRRAILLRSLLGKMDEKRGGRERLQMDPGLLAALLEAGHYEHGSRSFEKIVLSLKAGGLLGLHRSSLPSDAVLEMNIGDLRKFKEIMDEPLGFQQHASILAAAIHARWMEFADPTNEFRKAFALLNSQQKGDNRAAATRIPAILGLVGLRLVDKKDKLPPVKTIDSILESQIELLAEEEHIGWMEVRLKNGWKAVERTEDKALRIAHRDAQLSDCLIPYAKLPEKEKEKDRKSILWYPKMAKLAGFKIVARR